jgi:hypothetical protein
MPQTVQLLNFERLTGMLGKPASESRRSTWPIVSAARSEDSGFPYAEQLSRVEPGTLSTFAIARSLTLTLLPHVPYWRPRAQPPSS